MERKISWASGVFDEIELIYERAEKNPQIAAILSELETQALQEGVASCEILRYKGEPMTEEAYRSMPADFHEAVMCNLSQLGLSRFTASFNEPIITATFSAHLPQVLGCTIFNILNRLEKLDGAYNVMFFPKATLNLQVPLGGKKGLIKYEMLIMQLYPWLSVSETSTNEVAELPKEKTASGVLQPQKPEENVVQDVQNLICLLNWRIKTLNQLDTRKKEAEKQMKPILGAEPSAALQPQKPEDRFPNEKKKKTASLAPKAEADEQKKSPMRSKLSNFLRKMADSLSKE